MKKIFFYAVMTLMSLVFTSCDKNKGDVIEGTWKEEFWTSGVGHVEITYIFNGTGKYTSTFIEDGNELSSSIGTYVIKENNTIVHLHGVSTNAEGICKEYDSELMLDLESTPPTLKAYVYDSDGNILQTLIFKKL